LNTDSIKEKLRAELEKFNLKLLPPTDQIFAEEIWRTCVIDPPIERVYVLPTTSVLFNNRLVTECKRIFDITASSSGGRALYDIEELKRISKLGHSLRNGYLVHTHHKSYNPTPSVADVAAFLTTDAALGLPLNYLVISATKDTVSVKTVDFKHCYDCIHFCRFLKDAPLLDSKIGYEVEGT